MRNVAVVQLMSTEDVDHNLTMIDRFVTEAAAAGADFVAIPENAVFLRIQPESRAPIQPLSGPIVSRLRALAEQLGIVLLVGSFPEEGPDETHCYNTSVLIDGTLPGAPVVASYRKIHLFDIDIVGKESHRESDTIAPGDRLVVTDVGGVPTGLSICYDLRFPALYQGLVDLGAQVITVPAAFTEYTGKEHWLTLLKARAIETQTYVVAPNQYGHHGGKRRSYGKSTIIDPWGIPLCVAPDRPGWVMARLDFEYQREVRSALPCLQHRRPLTREG